MIKFHIYTVLSTLQSFHDPETLLLDSVLEVSHVYQKGDLIVYGSSGVCQVEEIGPLKGAGGVKEVREYYTLSPVFGSGVIYIPSDTGMFMRPVLTKEQVDSLIDRIPTLEGDTCDISTLRALSEQYHAAFESHRCEDLLRLIKALYLKEQNSVRQGRRVGLTEIKYRKHAEELIHGEFSVALGIPVEEVPNYISARLSNAEQ